MASFLDFDPWARQGRFRRRFTIAQPRLLVGGVIAAAVVTVAAEVAVHEWLTAVPALRTAAQIVLAAIVAGVTVSIAFVLPIYRIVPLTAQHVRAGAVLVTSPHGLMSEACVVASTFVYHGAARTEAWIGLSDGSDIAIDIVGDLHVAEPRDLFARFRARPAEGRRPPEQPSGEALGVLAAIWDVRLRVNHDDVLVDEVTAEYGDNPSTEINELVRLRLIQRNKRGIGRAQKIYVTLTATGMITLASALRERGVEIYDNAGKEVPVVINNSGIIVNGSPGAIANLGDGHVITGLTPDVSGALSALSEAAIALLNRIDEPREHSRLADAADELQHELNHPQRSERRLKKFAASVVEIGGSGIAALMGNAAWGVLAIWLGLANAG